MSQGRGIACHLGVVRVTGAVVHRTRGVVHVTGGGQCAFHYMGTKRLRQKGGSACFPGCMSSLAAILLQRCVGVLASWRSGVSVFCHARLVSHWFHHILRSGVSVFVMHDWSPIGVTFLRRSLQHPHWFHILAPKLAASHRIFVWCSGVEVLRYECRCLR